MKMESEIQVTSVQIKKVNNYKVKGIATIVINNSICIRGIRIIQGNSNLLQIRMPNVRNREGEFKDIVFPINKDVRKILEDTIIKNYNELNLKI